MDSKRAELGSFLLGAGVKADTLLSDVEDMAVRCVSDSASDTAAYFKVMAD